MALIEAKADPNLDDLRLDDTPLHYAARLGATKVSAALIRAGARIDKKLENGWTPLHYVARDCGVEMLDILNEQQELPESLLEAQDNDGCTALHWAAAYDRLDIIEWLLKHKANPLSVNKWGNNALHEAARAGSIKIMKILLRAGVPPELKNKQGLCARELAEKNGFIIKEMQADEEKPPKKSVNKNFMLKQRAIINTQKAQLEEQAMEIKKLRTLLEEQNQKLQALSSGIKSPISASLSLGLDDKKLEESWRPYSFFQKVPQIIVQLAERTKIDLVYLFTCYNEGKPNEDYHRIDKLQFYLMNYADGRKPSLSKEAALKLSLQECKNLQRCYSLIADELMKIEEAKALKDQQSDNLTGIGFLLVQNGILSLDKVINLSKPQMDEIRDNYSKKRLDLQASVNAALKKYQSSALTI